MMKKYFVTGLVILLPIAVTVIILVFLVDLFTAPFFGIVHHVLLFVGQNVVYLQKHQTLLLFTSRIIVLIFLFFLIIILGYVGTKFFSNFLQNTFHKIMMKIPFVKKIYRIVRDITKTFFADKEKMFESTVIVPFPHENTYALGLQSADAPAEALQKGKHLKSGCKSIFIPTSPHPISGFLVMMNEDMIKQTDITTEEAFKFLISAGTFKPEDKKDGQSKN
ncbi:hypothetical protein COB11_05450 [Candidatus Aerophobetes bacterium]|uniref:DUF502 domain-containing protein n=1 Tax=Aerophobetes bacterium TaxID=2030807 RepID=A0A2A4YF84_UNCAE|nr:MAG: hypothetical protein COB11_05450 [Candidatus Aerophobetes bacterium]